jgi:hypothetical protein
VAAALEFPSWQLDVCSKMRADSLAIGCGAFASIGDLRPTLELVAILSKRIVKASSKVKGNSADDAAQGFGRLCTRLSVE